LEIFFYTEELEHTKDAKKRNFHLIHDEQECLNDADVKKIIHGIMEKVVTNIL